jgi:hypothetical protein
MSDDAENVIDPFANTTMPRMGGCGGCGAYGGGVIWIYSFNGMQIDGTVTASGANATSGILQPCGGGAGGSILLDAGNNPLNGAGLVQAIGGNGIDDGGGGGGGRIVIRKQQATSVSSYVYGGTSFPSDPSKNLCVEGGGGTYVEYVGQEAVYLYCSNPALLGSARALTVLPQSFTSIVNNSITNIVLFNCKMASQGGVINLPYATGGFSILTYSKLTTFQNTPLLTINSPLGSIVINSMSSIQVSAFQITCNQFSTDTSSPVTFTNPSFINAASSISCQYSMRDGSSQSSQSVSTLLLQAVNITFISVPSPTSVPTQIVAGQVYLYASQNIFLSGVQVNARNPPSFLTNCSSPIPLPATCNQIPDAGTSFSMILSAGNIIEADVGGLTAPSVYICSKNATLSVSIDVSGQGCAAGQGAGTPVIPSSSGGAGHGGEGGVGCQYKHNGICEYAVGGQPYSSVAHLGYPIGAGSGGGLGTKLLTPYAGSGGGVVAMQVSQVLSLSNQILVSGTSASASGSGSGSYVFTNFVLCFTDYISLFIVIGFIVLLVCFNSWFPRNLQ